MEKYTWDEIINNPRSERAKACVGKEVYFAYTPINCLEYANNHNNDFLDVLKEINPESIVSFYSINGLKSSYIIPKKEEKPEEYVPFSNKEEFLSAYEEHTKSMKKYGIWIFNNINGIDYRIACLITEIWNDGIVIGSAMGRTLWKYLLESFVFEDGTPCGKEIKE